MSHPQDPSLPKALRTPRGGQGQWGAGHTEPLNPNERWKKDQGGLEVRARIENVYAVTGFAGIDPVDLRGRFRWWGLYTQRREGIDGGLTATLEPEELEAEFFMLRARIPGGRVTSEQLRVLASVATTYGRDVADITDRQNIQLHWIRVEDVPAIWRELEAVGLSTAEACGDTPRNMLGCPLAGVDAAQVLDATETLLAVNERFTGDPAFANLPRKFKTSISGCAKHCSGHEINDVAFVGVEHEGALGFDLWVGGGLSTDPRLGQRLGVFVLPEQAAEVWAGVATVYREWGYRRSRTRARIKFLMADWGPERFRAVLERQLGFALPDGPAPAAAHEGRRDHVGVTVQTDGRYALGAVARSGRTSGTVLAQVAELASRHGRGRVVLTAEQKLVVLDIGADDVETVVAALAELDLLVRPSAFRRGTMACTGLEFCKLAITETKSTADLLVAELEERLPTFDRPLRINVNGCPNSCARIQVADVGLKGMQVTTADGRRVDGFQVHLGGSLSGHGDEPSALGRKVRGLKVTAEDLPSYVEGLVTNFVASGEASFTSWVRDADAAVLAERSSELMHGVAED